MKMKREVKVNSSYPFFLTIPVVSRHRTIPWFIVDEFGAIAYMVSIPIDHSTNNDDHDILSLIFVL